MTSFISAILISITAMASNTYEANCRETKLALLGHENEATIIGLNDANKWAYWKSESEAPDGEFYGEIHEVKCLQEYSSDTAIVFFYAENNSSSAIRDCGIYWPQKKTFVRDAFRSGPWEPTPLADCLAKIRQ